jgi:hypothetical protein
MAYLNTLKLVYNADLGKKITIGGQMKGTMRLELLYNKTSFKSVYTILILRGHLNNT